MASVRHLIIEGSSSSVDNGGAGTISYHTLYLPHATQQTVQQCFGTDGAGLPEMVARQASVIAALQDGPNILFVQAGQNDLLTMDHTAWLSSFSDYLDVFRASIASSGKIVKLGISTHNPRNDVQFNAHRGVADQALRLFPDQGKCDFVVDWAVDPTWGTDAAARDQKLYPDGTHPSQAGQSNMEAKYFCPVLNALFDALI